MKIKGVAVYAIGQQLNDTTAKSKRIQHTAFNGQLPMLYVRQNISTSFPNFVFGGKYNADKGIKIGICRAYTFISDFFLSLRGNIIDLGTISSLISPCWHETRKYPALDIFSYNYHTILNESSWV